MPTTVNLKGGGLQLGTYFTVSIVYQAFQDTLNTAAEVAVGTAKYLILDLWSARNATGTRFGTAYLMLPVPLLEWSHTTTVDDAIAATFPPPAPDV